MVITFPDTLIDGVALYSGFLYHVDTRIHTQIISAF